MAVWVAYRNTPGGQIGGQGERTYAEAIRDSLTTAQAPWAVREIMASVPNNYVFDGRSLFVHFNDLDVNTHNAQQRITLRRRAREAVLRIDDWIGAIRSWKQGLITQAWALQQIAFCQRILYNNSASLSQWTLAVEMIETLDNARDLSGTGEDQNLLRVWEVNAHELPFTDAQVRAGRKTSERGWQRLLRGISQNYCPIFLSKYTVADWPASNVIASINIGEGRTPDETYMPSVIDLTGYTAWTDNVTLTANNMASLANATNYEYLRAFEEDF